MVYYSPKDLIIDIIIKVSDGFKFYAIPIRKNIYFSYFYFLLYKQKNIGKLRFHSIKNNPEQNFFGKASNDIVFQKKNWSQIIVNLFCFCHKKVHKW